MRYLIAALIAIVVTLIGGYLVALISIVFWGTEAAYFFSLVGCVVFAIPSIFIFKWFIRKYSGKNTMKDKGR